MAILVTPSILTDRLVMYCDGKNQASYSGSGNTWADVSGNGNSLTRNSANIAWNTGGWWNFNNTNAQGQRLGAANQVVQRTGSFSVMVVFRRNSTANPFGNGEQVFSNAGGADGFRCGFGSSGNLVYLIGGGGGTGYQEGSLGGSGTGNNTWQTATWVFDRGAELGDHRVYGYVNRSQSGSVAISAGASGNTAFQTGIASMGYDVCCALLRGDIAAVMAYNKALSGTEVEYNYYCMRAIHGVV